MKSLATTIGLLILLLQSTNLFANNFKQGEHYFTLDKEVSKVQQITEYFSFYCPACFRQEPFMKQLKSKLPNQDNFKKNHVTAMPGRDIESETMLSKALATARLLKIEEQINGAIFNYIHVNRANFSNVKDVKNLFLLQGIDSATFDKTFASFKVNMEAKRMAANTQKLRDKGYISVPTIVINNNYIPNVRSIKSMQEYEDLVQYLLSKK
jgi:thiol:disulfide interchange protein DsbA